MDKEETKTLAHMLVSIHLLAEALEEIHKQLTEMIIQKGTNHDKGPGSFNYHGN